ncbi:hypothetical protein [Carnobacterium sp.]|uniref:hypothetical protein n=1 Tax=Carnobacterium sp. TaxID=48221 RepID=UPI002648D2B2|nr:hypothetical protein [Carnobacterium sp.]
MKENEFEEQDRKKHSEIFSAIKSKSKDIEDYKAIFPYILKVSPKIIAIVAKDIINDWSCSDIYFYVAADVKDERVLYYRQAYINGLSYTDRDWLMMLHAIPPVDDGLYDISLNALANKVPFKIVRLFWSEPGYEIYHENNIQLLQMFIRKGFTLAESLYLTYISIKYQEEIINEGEVSIKYSQEITNECEILIKNKYDIDKIDEKIKEKYSREI